MIIPRMAAEENFAPLRDYLARPEGFRARQRFAAWARRVLSLPPDGTPDYLRPEVWWQDLLAAVPDAAAALAALSQATGIYFFPSREWPPRLVRFLVRLGVRRLLEAGAGRGYLSQALAPLARQAGLGFLAVDRGEGEFVSGLGGSPVVAPGDAFQAVHDFRPQAVFYGWPPPGQSLAPFFSCGTVRWLIVAGEPGGGVTGAREDWLGLPHRPASALSRYSRGRGGPERHAVTIFLRPARRARALHISPGCSAPAGEEGRL